MPHANAYPIAGAVKNGYHAEGYPTMPMVPHGQAVSATAPSVFRWTYPGDPVRHLRAAELLSGQTFTDRTATEKKVRQDAREKVHKLKPKNREPDKKQQHQPLCEPRQTRTPEEDSEKTLAHKNKKVQTHSLELLKYIP